MSILDTKSRRHTSESAIFADAAAGARAIGATGASRAGAAREESIMAMVTMDGRKVVRTCGLSCFSADERSDQESSHCK